MLGGWKVRDMVLLSNSQLFAWPADTPLPEAAPAKRLDVRLCTVAAELSQAKSIYFFKVTES